MLPFTTNTISKGETMTSPPRKLYDDFIDREVATVMAAMQMSQVTLNASWGEDSFGAMGESSSLLDFRRNFQMTCDCIDGALSVLENSIQERQHKVPALLSTTEDQSTKLDSPPSHPQRYSDGDSGREGRTIDVDSGRSCRMIDRFKLSKSENMSLSFRAPKRPNRTADMLLCEDSSSCLKTRPSLNVRSESARDVSIKPPTRAPSGNVVATSLRR